MIYKNRSFLILMFLTTLLWSCKNKTTQFFIDYQQEITLPEGTNRWVVEANDIQTDCQVRFEKNDTKRSKVHKIFLKNITMVSQQEGILKSVQLKAIHMQCPSISKKRIEIGSIHAIYSDTSVQFQLMESAEDVKEFIKHAQFSIELYFSGQKLKKEIDATLIFEFLVEGELIKTILHQRMLV